MKNLRLTLLAALLAISASQVAFAQAPAPGAPGTAGTTGATTTTADNGAITNDTAVTTTTTTTSGIAPDVSAVPLATTGTIDAVPTDDTLTNTGGEPVLMSLAGLALALSAFAFRRKVTA